ncbi:hypothetical protein [[Acholeplasma] multilocale]|nr:hypothetical protein [[Acholeplasma] multilocale]
MEKIQSRRIKPSKKRIYKDDIDESILIDRPVGKIKSRRPK